MTAQETEAINRRRFLKLATAVPALGALAAIVSPLLRFLKPNVEKLNIRRPRTIGLIRLTAQDTPRGETVIAGTLSEVAKPWDFKYFVFTQKYPQYTPQGFRAASVPGLVVRLPLQLTLYDPATGRGPLAWAKEINKVPKVTTSDLIVFSRICPHLGCIYNFVANWKEITAGYGGFVPPPSRQHALMGCPCHLSIYDPADAKVPGRVLSGPAPRPPRTFLFEIQGENIVVTDVEPGGIA